METILDYNPIPDFFYNFSKIGVFYMYFTGFVTTRHLQASADAVLSYKPGRPVTRGGHINYEWICVNFTN